MKKSLKIYGWAWVAVIAATLITIAVIAIHPSHHDLARDANNIEKIVKVDLPDIAYSESWDNLDRSASRWDVYEHHGEFVEELSYESTMAMDELCQIDSLRWRKTEDGQYYVNHAVRTGYIKNAELKTRSNLTYYEYMPD